MKRLASFLLLGAVAGFASCSSGPTIVTSSDPNADFADFETYGFMQPLSSDQGDSRSLISAFLIEATMRELGSRGLMPVGNSPDLLINFLVSTRDSFPTRTVPSHISPYGTWTGYSMQTSTMQVAQRSEGTIAVDVVDNARKQLVWEGAATGMVTEDMRDNLQATVNDAIADIFADFPN